MRRIVHTSAAALAAILLIATPIGLGATPRLDGMGMPTLSFSAAVPASFPNLQFQADDFGQGASFVRDVYDPFEFPQTLVDRDLFPRSRAIFNYTGAGQGSGGVYLNLDGLLNRPFAVGVYANAPDRNGAAIGEGRGDLAGLGATFGADVTNAVTTFGSLPGAPANIADLFVAAQLGSMVSLGASFGLAYDKTADDSNSIVGTADSTTTDKATSRVWVGRLGSSVFLDDSFVREINLGASVRFNQYSASYVSGAAAVPSASQNDTITANNLAWDVNGRFKFRPLWDTVDPVLLAGFTYMPQNYGATDNASALDTTTTRLDDTRFWSTGGGVGVNWNPKPGALVNASSTVVYGSGKWTQEAPGAGNRPQDSTSWVTWAGNLGAEVPLTDWFKIRGGLGTSKTWAMDALNADTGGTSSEFHNFDLNTWAAAGVGLKLADPVYFDFVVNLNNFTSAAAFQTLIIAASLQAEL